MLTPKICLHCRLAGLECETKVVLILSLCQALINKLCKNIIRRADLERGVVAGKIWE